MKIGDSIEEIVAASPLDERDSIKAYTVYLLNGAVSVSIIDLFCCLYILDLIYGYLQIAINV